MKVDRSQVLSLLAEYNITFLKRRQFVGKLGSVVEKMVFMRNWNWNKGMEGKTIYERH
jgi:hypothetical protein